MTKMTKMTNKDKQQQRISGMPCPNCQGFIPISMYQLLTAKSIFCPICGLRLNMNKDGISDKSREILKKLENIKKEHNETI